MFKFKKFFKEVYNFMNKYRLLVFGIFILIFAFVFAFVVFAQNSRNEGYFLDAGKCKDDIYFPLPDNSTAPGPAKFCNEGTVNYFIPTRTYAEWNALTMGVIGPQVIADLNLISYCGDGVCNASDITENNCCPDCSAAPNLCHNDTFCSFGELPIGYEYYYDTGYSLPYPGYTYQSIDCAWRSSSDYQFNYIVETQNLVPCEIYGDTGCYCDKYQELCRSRIYSAPKNYLGFFSGDWMDQWPDDITKGYTTCYNLIPLVEGGDGECYDIYGNKYTLIRAKTFYFGVH